MQRAPSAYSRSGLYCSAELKRKKKNGAVAGFWLWLASRGLNHFSNAHLNTSGASTHVNVQIIKILAGIFSLSSAKTDLSMQLRESLRGVVIFFFYSFAHGCIVLSCTPGVQWISNGVQTLLIIYILFYCVSTIYYYKVQYYNKECFSFKTFGGGWKYQLKLTLGALWSWVSGGRKQVTSHLCAS